MKKFLDWLKELDLDLHEVGVMPFRVPDEIGYRGFPGTEIKKIQKAGLVPNWDFTRKNPLVDDGDFHMGMSLADQYGLDVKKKYLFFSSSMHDAATYGDILLRFPMPPDSITVESTGRDYIVTATPIPPKMLEIQEDFTDEWIPLLDAEIQQDHSIRLKAAS